MQKERQASREHHGCGKPVEQEHTNVLDCSPKALVAKDRLVIVESDKARVDTLARSHLSQTNPYCVETRPDPESNQEQGVRKHKERDCAAPLGGAPPSRAPLRLSRRTHASKAQRRLLHTQRLPNDLVAGCQCGPSQSALVGRHSRGHRLTVLHRLSNRREIGVLVRV